MACWGRLPSFILKDPRFQPIFEISDLRHGRKRRYLRGKPELSTLAQKILLSKVFLVFTGLTVVKGVIRVVAGYCVDESWKCLVLAQIFWLY
ncbi:MAG: hypothetical protein N2050_09625 [Flavobacteriales bacterium]|nr:hypothetical protein [Flavobacteriales bacterium]